MDLGGDQMNLLPYIQFFLEFLRHDYLDGLYVALISFAVMGIVIGITGKRRYINV